MLNRGIPLAESPTIVVANHNSISQKISTQKQAVLNFIAENQSAFSPFYEKNLMLTNIIHEQLFSKTKKMIHRAVGKTKSQI